MGKKNCSEYHEQQANNILHLQWLAGREARFSMYEWPILGSGGEGEKGGIVLFVLLKVTYNLSHSYQSQFLASQDSNSHEIWHLLTKQSLLALRFQLFL